jgi:hypothetical protein
LACADSALAETPPASFSLTTRALLC